MSFAMCTLENNILSSRPLELVAGESDRDQQSQIGAHTSAGLDAGTRASGNVAWNRRLRDRNEFCEHLF